MAEDVPQANLRPDDHENPNPRKKANAAVRSEFRGIVAAGARGNRVSTARDGRGNAATVRTGTDLGGGNGAQGEPATRSRNTPFIQHPPSRRASTKPADEDDDALRREVEAMENENRMRGNIPLVFPGGA